MERIFSPSLLLGAVWSFPSIMQQLGSNNENKYLTHLTQVVLIQEHKPLKKSPIEFSLIDFLKSHFPPQILNCIMSLVVFL